MIPLVGTWSTTYSGWSHFHPRPVQHETETRAEFYERMTNLPPIIGGHRCVPHWDIAGNRREDTFEQREGYFLIAGLLCLTFTAPSESAPGGTLTGFERFNRGAIVGNELEIEIIRGEWVTLPHSRLPEIQIGTIHTVHRDRSPSGGQEVQNNYAFVVRNSDEIDWIVYSTHLAAENPIETRHRARLAEGTLRRVTTL